VRSTRVQAPAGVPPASCGRAGCSSSSCEAVSACEAVPAYGGVDLGRRADCTHEICEMLAANATSPTRGARLSAPGALHLVPQTCIAFAPPRYRRRRWRSADAFVHSPCPHAACSSFLSCIVHGRLSALVGACFYVSGLACTVHNAFLGRRARAGLDSHPARACPSPSVVLRLLLSVPLSRASAPAATLLLRAPNQL